MNKFLLSVGYALQGIVVTLRTERNINIQLSIFTAVLLAGWWFSISHFEWLLMLGISALVLSLELVNTAVERLVDKLSPGYDEDFGRVKDIMAGAVLVASLFAAVIGLLIFGLRLLEAFQP